MKDGTMSARGQEEAEFDQPPLVGTEADQNDVVIGRVICERESPSLDKVLFRLLPGQDTTAGRVLGVRGKQINGPSVLTLIRVEGVWEQNPHEDALSSTVSDVIPFETRYAPEIGRAHV